MGTDSDKPDRDSKLPEAADASARSQPGRAASELSETVARVETSDGSPDPFRWIEHRNTELLLIEFRPGTREDSLATLGRFTEVLSSKLPGSILFLADLTQAPLWSQVALEWQRAQDLVDAKCRRVAAIGARGVIRTAAQIFLEVAASSGTQIAQKVRFFADAQTASDWLVDGRDGK